MRALFRPLQTLSPLVAAVGSIAIGCGGHAVEEAEFSDRAQTPTSPARVAGPDVRDTPDSRLDQAASLLVAGRWAASEELLHAVLQEHPRHGRAELLLGVGLHERKLYPRARPHFERVVERGPTFEGQTVVHYWLGWCRYYLGDLEGAQASFEQHLIADPEEGDSHFGLGLIAWEQGQLDVALEQFELSIERHQAVQANGGPTRAPEIAKAHARMADVHLARERLDDALRELDLCIALEPAHYAAYYKLHEIHQRQGDTASAKRALQLHELWKRRARGG